MGHVHAPERLGGIMSSMRYKSGEEPKVGDVVYLNSGSSPLTVVKVVRNHVSVSWPDDDGFTADAECFTTVETPVL
jgi:hypothetical protein